MPSQAFFVLLHVLTESVMIRPVKPEDATDIANIYNEYVLHSVATFETEAVSVPEMRRRIERFSAQFPYFVFEDGNHVAGYAYAHLWQERAAYRQTWETTVYVSGRHVGKGIGTQLMSRLILSCHEAGCHALIACITHENAGSRRLHQKLGFRQVSLFKEVGWKFGRWLDVSDWELLL